VATSQTAIFRCNDVEDPGGFARNKKLASFTITIKRRVSPTNQPRARQLPAFARSRMNPVAKRITPRLGWLLPTNITGTTKSCLPAVARTPHPLRAFFFLLFSPVPDHKQASTVQRAQIFPFPVGVSAVLRMPPLVLSAINRIQANAPRNRKSTDEPRPLECAPGSFRKLSVPTAREAQQIPQAPSSQQRTMIYTRKKWARDSRSERVIYSSSLLAQ